MGRYGGRGGRGGRGGSSVAFLVGKEARVSDYRQVTTRLRIRPRKWLLRQSFKETRGVFVCESISIYSQCA